MEPEQKPPYGAYAVITAAFCGGLAGAGLLARALGRDPQEHTTLDLVTLALATYKAARTLSRDESSAGRSWKGTRTKAARSRSRTTGCGKRSGSS